MTFADALTPGALGVAALAACWIMLPAWLPNPIAALFGGGRPIDGGRVLRDGYRVLGNGKTWRGFAAGVLAGLAIGAVEIAAQGLFLGFAAWTEPEIDAGAEIIGRLIRKLPVAR